MNLDDLKRANDYVSLSRLFGVAAPVLKANLYSSSGHSVFPISKKSGGVRLVASPNDFRKALQRSLLPVLEGIYKPNKWAHGFVAKRSVRTNAEPHVNRASVVNVDLKDFFPSITFQRVRGIFLASPMQISWATANVLAQLCCFNGALSTGGVTSPVLSNIACARLDKRLAALTSRLGGRYTRYADDLTFSFDRPLKHLSGLVLIDDKGGISVGAALSEIISGEGFQVNNAKLRVSGTAARKMVTGVVVNEKTNVRRTWYRNVESKVYAIERFGLNQVAATDHPEIGDSGVAERKVLRRLHGKISYLSMIRGAGDWVAADLAHRFNMVHKDPRLRVPSVEIISTKARLARAPLVVNCSDAPLLVYDAGANQGTGFVTRSGLIVTAAHVVVNDSGARFPHIYVMSERRLAMTECSIEALDNARDVAILKPVHAIVELERHRITIGDDAEAGEELLAIGFPNYILRDRPSIIETRVVQLITDAGVRKAAVGGALQGGLSGGPVVDSEFRVRGIVHKGVATVGGVAQIVRSSEIVRVATGAGLRLQ